MNFRRALVVYRVNREDISNLGVVHKLMGQVQGLEQLGIEVDYITYSGRNIFLNQKLIANGALVVPDLWFKFQFWNYLPYELDAYNLILIRHTLLVPSFIEWLNKVRHNVPQCKIIIDMPTYPYEGEWKGWKRLLGLRIDKKLQNRLSEYINYILHSGPEKFIFGIPVISFSNGIDADRILVKNDTEIQVNPFTMIAVGKWQFWHGLDRVINGMNNYKGARELELLVIGDGPVIDELKKLTKAKGVAGQVQFLGPKTGADLDQYFNKAHIGIGTLGLHRKNVQTDSSLKHREYCARGLPFVLSSPDIDFPSALSFIHYTGIRDTPIEVEKLIAFIDRLDHRIIIAEMRKYAETNLSWSMKMKAALEQL